MLCFGYVAFLGLNYHLGGDVLWAAAAVLLGLVALSLCMKEMCKSKRTQGRKKGMTTELGMAALAFVVIGLGIVPFSLMTDIVGNEDKFQNQWNAMVEHARTIGPEYQRYANARVESFREHLYEMRGTEYYNVVKDMPHESKTQTIDALCTSLQHRLLPATLDEADSLHNAWLDEVENANVWNALTPNVIFKICDVEKTWVDEYRNLSATFYKGEVAGMFKMQDLDGSFERYKRDVTEFSVPNVLSIMAGLICFGFFLTPYISVRRGKRE